MSEKQTPPPWAHPVTFYQLKCTHCGDIQSDYGDFMALSEWDHLPDADSSWHIDGDVALRQECAMNTIGADDE